MIFEEESRLNVGFYDAHENVCIKKTMTVISLDKNMFVYDGFWNTRCVLYSHNSLFKMFLLVHHKKYYVLLRLIIIYG